MKIKITEQQLNQVLSELDVAAITKAAEEYGKSQEGSQKAFEDAIAQALGQKKEGMSEEVLEESLIDYSLIFKALQHVLSPEQMQFMKDSYQVMHYTSIDHLPTLRTGEIFLFLEYMLYVAGISSLKNKIKSTAEFIAILPKLGYYLVGGIVKRIKKGKTPKEIVNDFMNAMKNSEENDEILQENLVLLDNSRIFAERKFTKRQIYDTVTKIYEQSSSSTSKT